MMCLISFVFESVDALIFRNSHKPHALCCGVIIIISHCYLSSIGWCSVIVVQIERRRGLRQNLLEHKRLLEPEEESQQWAVTTVLFLFR